MNKMKIKEEWKFYTVLLSLLIAVVILSVMVGIIAAEHFAVAEQTVGCYTCPLT